MSRRGNSQRHSGREGQIQKFERIDPFRQMQQMMVSFGGMHNDPFLNGMMGFGMDPFEDIFKFSDIHKNVHNRGTQGSYVFQSFVSSSKIGPDGKVVRQDYFENNMGQNRAGNTISQKQQAYKNNQGVNRIAQQRMLNDRGHKIVRQKIGNNIEQTNHYYNIDQQEAQQFNNDWKQTDSKLKFLENHQKYLNQVQYQPRQMQIGYQPQVRTSHQVPQNYQQLHQSNNPQIRNQPYQHSRISQENSRIQQQPTQQINYLPSESTNGSRGSRRTETYQTPVNTKNQQSRKY